MNIDDLKKRIGINRDITENELINLIGNNLHLYKYNKWNNEAVTDLFIFRYGLNGNKPHTLQELGDIYGLCKESIRQIESKALRRIRDKLNNET